MPSDRRILESTLLSLALLASANSLAASAPAADPVASAKAFVETMAQGHFTRAEADFTAQMRQAAPPAKLRQLWKALIRHGGAFEKTGATRTMHEDGYTAVIVRTEFKKSPIGLEVAFDAADRIAGLHLVRPPRAGH